LSRFGLFGKFTAQPGQRDRLVEHLLDAARFMEDAKGCELYVVSTSESDANGVWVTEIWESEADHDASLALDGVLELIERARPLIAEMSDRVELVPVGGKGLSTR
jgi:quinol monooxygenase YgiN